MVDRQHRSYGQLQRQGTRRRIGLTGGIATGKSTAAHILTGVHGLTVVDADHFARAALAPGTAATHAVLQRYGAVVETQDGSIHRRSLARIVFAAAAERHWLEQLVHPLVHQDLLAALAAHHQLDTVVLMVPLLFEAGWQTLCSETWLVDLDEATQRQRLQQRDRLTTQEINHRLGAQWPMARKRQLADVVLDNRGNRHSLRRQIAIALQAGPLAAGSPQDSQPPGISP